jgi:hypothetical protein
MSYAALPAPGTNAQLMDFKCVEFVEELMFGQWRKNPEPVTRRKALLRRRLLLVTILVGGPALRGAVASADRRTGPRPISPPRLADGQPDLQGTYDLATLTPLERPNGMKRGALARGSSQIRGSGGRFGSTRRAGD